MAGHVEESQGAKALGCCSWTQQGRSRPRREHRGRLHGKILARLQRRTQNSQRSGRLDQCHEGEIPIRRFALGTRTWSEGKCQTLTDKVHLHRNLTSLDPKARINYRRMEANEEIQDRG